MELEVFLNYEAKNFWSFFENKLYIKKQIENKYFKQAD